MLGSFPLRTRKVCYANFVSIRDAGNPAAPSSSCKDFTRRLARSAEGMFLLLLTPYAEIGFSDYKARLESGQD